MMINRTYPEYRVHYYDDKIGHIRIIRTVIWVTDPLLNDDKSYISDIWCHYSQDQHFSEIS
jgi:hypothetical protein